MTLETSCSLPGMGCELMITTSPSLSVSQRFSLAAMSDRADMGSPCEPVEMTHTFSGGEVADVGDVDAGGTRGC